MKYFLIISALLALSSAAPLGNVSLKFIGSSITDVYTITKDGSWTAIPSVYFNSTRKNLIYINSFYMNFDSFDIDVIFKPYLNSRRAEWNLIYLDYSNYTFDINFLNTVKNVNGIAEFVGDMLKQMKTALYPLFSSPYYHIIGFDLGAHFAGAVARQFSVNRITALSPWGFFDYSDAILMIYSFLKPVGWTDCGFVDVIHTDKLPFEYKSPTGHLDFFVNEGNSQPNCFFGFGITDLFSDFGIQNAAYLNCNKARSIFLYAETVSRNSTSKPFISAMCQLNPPAYDSANCKNTNNKVSMGYHAVGPICGPLNLLDCVSSNYYVATNDASPYSKT